MQQWLLMLMIFNNMFFNMCHHPLMLSICLFFKTFIICVYLCLNNWSSWFSYILFLVFVGGLLILLMYTITLIGNRNFTKKEVMLMQDFLILLGVGILFYINIYFLSSSLDFENILFVQSYEQEFFLSKLFMFPNLFMNVFLICYLFMLLIVSTKIILTLFGPLRICKYLTNKK